MKTLSEKIIEQLQSKHDAFLGTKGELSRQRFKDGLMWAIDTIETLTEVDNCEKKHEAEQLLIHGVVDSMPKTQDFLKKLSSKIENNHKSLDELSKEQLLLGGKYAYRIINDLKKQD